MITPDLEALGRMLSDLGVPVSVAAICGTLRLEDALAAAEAKGRRQAAKAIHSVIIVAAKDRDKMTRLRDWYADIAEDATQDAEGV